MGIKMVYGVLLSKENFVFTRFGITTIGMLPLNSEILGVSGIGKFTKFQKVEMHNNKLALLRDARRLITQTTDSVLLPETLLFSEKIQNADQLISNNEIEFFKSQPVQNFTPGLDKSIINIPPEDGYAAGLLSKPIYQDKKCIVFLLRNAGKRDYLSIIEKIVKNFIRKTKTIVLTEIRPGKLGYAWVVIKGNEINQISNLLSNISPENACMKLEMKKLQNFVAGMLDAHIANPSYGGRPVLTFSTDESTQKRFLQNMLLLFNSQILETSCITSHSPKLLETKILLTKNIPVRNPVWEDLEYSDKSILFSKIRSVIKTQTVSTEMIFEEQGFSPIVDGLYACPCILQK
jgi:hypothetical protein